MKRRAFITLLGGAAAAWPLAARGQQARMPVLGFLGSASEADYKTTTAAVRRGLSEAGYVEKQNLLIDYRWANFQYDRLPALAAELVKRPVDAIFTTGSVVSALAAKAATASIPIVFANGSDPVEYGLVASLNRPGGNVTGVTLNSTELGTKLLGLLIELLPGAARIAVLVDPNFPNTEPFVSSVRAAALVTRKQIEVLDASTARDIDTAFASLAQKPVDALLVGPTPLFNNRRVQLVTLAAYHRVPGIHFQREAAEAGFLMSYGTSHTDAYRQAGVYTGRILKGEKPADLPVMQSIKFEFVINSIPPGHSASACRQGCSPLPTSGGVC